MAGEIRSVEQAAAFVERVGVALAFPKADLVLPSLWEAIAGTSVVSWSVRDERGTFVSFTPEFDAVWRWKDELPERRLACGGKHVAGAAAFISPTLLSSFYARTGRAGGPEDFRSAELTSVQSEVAEAVLENGPCTGPELRHLLGTGDKRRVEAATVVLQKRLVLTSAGSVQPEHGWAAVSFDLLARRWGDCLRRLPDAETAASTIAETVLRTVGELSAADLAGVLGGRVKRASGLLEELVARGATTVREEDGIALFSPR